MEMNSQRNDYGLLDGQHNKIPQNFDRPWLKSYPKGVATDIDLSQFKSVLTVLDDACSKYADRKAFTNMGQSLSFAELDQKVNQMVSFYQHELGLKKANASLFKCRT